eukprot:6090161-Prymnesium_polylepis.1
MKRVADIASKSSFATQLVQQKMGDIHASLMQGEAHGAIEEYHEKVLTKMTTRRSSVILPIGRP